jgi:hypothetical protein
MAMELAVKAQESGSLVLEGTMKIGNTTIVPDANPTWTLTKLDGTVINSRQDVSVTPSGSTLTIVLSDADLQIFADDPIQVVSLPTVGPVQLRQGKRVLLVEFTYDSAAGNNLPVKHQTFFTVEEVIGN